MPRSRLKRAEQLQDLAAAARVEVAGGLVREQQDRVADDGARDRDALLLAAREFRSACARAPGEPDGGESARRALPGAPRGCKPGRAAAARRFRARWCAASRLEALEHEAEVVAAQQRALVARQRRRRRRPGSGSVPVVGTSRQPRMFIAVDLPEPLGPMIATNSCASMRRSMPRSALTAAAPSPWVRLTRFRTARDGSSMLSLGRSTHRRRVSRRVARASLRISVQLPSEAPGLDRDAPQPALSQLPHVRRGVVRGPGPGSRRTDVCPGAARPGRRVAATPRVPAARSAALHWEPAAPGSRAAPRSPPWPSSRAAAAARSCRPRPASRS